MDLFLSKIDQITYSHVSDPCSTELSLRFLFLKATIEDVVVSVVIVVVVVGSLR